MPLFGGSTAAAVLRVPSEGEVTMTPVITPAATTTEATVTHRRLARGISNRTRAQLTPIHRMSTLRRRTADPALNGRRVSGSMTAPASDSA
ncbi:hypothetical protein [Nonomuraea endophytica]|uniref:Uncharacterized protein n=1 Tax=Nonomuraea endophytica TaxID=714136 RepID=A0A7W8ACW3_9ACTN|nr:hypothetical protein [Nonomuraea endophytica]MBB5082880.1 hypothetical protein [Nonomuraea endophytica]